jgi:hypothetical protein
MNLIVVFAKFLGLLFALESLVFLLLGSGVLLLNLKFSRLSPLAVHVYSKGCNC